MAEKEIFMRKKRLVAAVAAIVALAAVLAALTFFGGEKEPQDVTDNENNSISIMNFDSDVTQYSVIRDGGYTFVKENGRWIEKSSSNIELDQNYVTTSVAKASFLYAESLVEENCKNLGAFGFDAPSAVVILTGADGKTAEIKFGAQTATGTGYYTVIGDSKDVYTVSSDGFEKVAGELSGFRVSALYSLADAQSVTHFRLKSKKYDINIGRKTKTSPNESNIAVWTMETPYSKDVNTNIFEENVVKCLTFTATDYIDDNPSDYGKYGLDAPQYIISVETADGVFTMHLGAEYEGNKIYARVDGKQSVYAISIDDVKYKDFTPIYLLESLVFVRNITSVSSIDFTSDKKRVFTIKNGVYSADGKNVNEDDFKEMYTNMISPVISGEADKAGAGKLLCSFTFSYNTGTPDETVEYYEYGDMYAAAKVNGKTEFYVKRKFVDDIIKSAEGLGK